jgi:hypothetical protein
MTDEIDLTKPIPEISPCETCGISTLRSNSHKSHIQAGDAPMDLIHSDVLGPFEIGLDGSRYFVTFLCNASQPSAIYCIKSKVDVFDCFRSFEQHNERSDRKIHRLRTDNGGEYTSKAMLRYLFLQVLPQNSQFQEIHNKMVPQKSLDISFGAWLNPF